MDIQDLSYRIREIIANELGMPSILVEEEDALATDLGAGSLDMIGIVIEFEDEFDINISADEEEHLHTVNDCISLVAGKIKEHA